jgi:hypothetical protein
MEYYQMTLTDWADIKAQLDEEFRLQQASFVKAGYLLRKIEETEGYKMDGSKSLAEWAKDRYGLSASTVSKYKAINERFSIDGYSDKLEPKFIGYGFSKLTDMLALPDQDLDQLDPKMKREEIRELKAFNKEAEAIPETASDLQTLVGLFWEAYSDVKEEILHQRAFSLEQFKECCIPSGNRVFRKAGFFLMMNETEIKYKKGMGAWQQVTWSAFMEASHPYMEKKEDEKSAEENPVPNPGPEVDPVPAGSDILDTRPAEPQGSGTAQAPAEDREPVEEEEESERDTVEAPGEEPDADPAGAAGGMESGSSEETDEGEPSGGDDEAGTYNGADKDANPEGEIPAVDDPVPVPLAGTVVAESVPSAGEDAEEIESLSDSMNEPEEDEEETVSPAQIAARSRAKIYFDNLQKAMDAGAWQRALSSCESLQKALREVVGR